MKITLMRAKNSLPMKLPSHLRKIKKTNMTKYFLVTLALAVVTISCQPKAEKQATAIDTPALKQVLDTEPVQHDTDDPAIWINAADSAQSLIIGTDKGGDSGRGGLYAFSLQGKIVKAIIPLKRPNNVDVAYGLNVNGKLVDIAVCTERYSRAIRVFSLPALDSIDNGGIPVFENEADSLRDAMGIALYTHPETKKIYAIVGRKTGPQNGTYLWQYELVANTKGIVSGKLVRKFGYYSGKKEIESIAVDNELGYVYHSDEQYGIHKSYAHPDSSTVELALFGTSGFTSDIEGISIYKTGSTTGYILVSDQQADQFRVFLREGLNHKHNHPELTAFAVSTHESDGSEITSVALPGYAGGLFVAMSDNKTFQYYQGTAIIEAIKKRAPNAK
jgi:3-phytase